MKAVMLKACKRCSGDLVINKDHQVGSYGECIQCGHIEYVRIVLVVVGAAA